jgi:hypothetical protein
MTRPGSLRLPAAALCKGERARWLVALVLCVAGAALLGCSEESSGGGQGVGGALPDNSSDTEPAELEGTLAAHNEARAAEGVPALTWDAELARIAAQWGEGCEDSDGNGLIDHNDERSADYPTYVGENIYASTGGATGPSAVGAWIEEEQDFDKGSCQCSGTCGHYTQVMWAETERVGCALVSCGSLLFASTVICNYAPGGNTGAACPF